MAVSRVRQAGGRTGGSGCRWNDRKAEATGKRFIEKETMGRNEALFTGPRTEGGVEEEADLEMGRCLGERGPLRRVPRSFECECRGSWPFLWASSHSFAPCPRRKMETLSQASHYCFSGKNSESHEQARRGLLPGRFGQQGPRSLGGRSGPGPLWSSQTPRGRGGLAGRRPLSRLSPSPANVQKPTCFLAILC